MKGDFMKEILGGELDKAFIDLSINAKKTYEGNTFLDDKTQIWELSDEDFERICEFDDKTWKDNWGWWRSAEGSNMSNPISRFNVNHHYMKAWDSNNRLEGLKYFRDYKNLLGYICDEIGASQPRNVCALAVDLAKINNMKLGELFKKYQG
jgi:hypothetical protein